MKAMKGRKLKKLMFERDDYFERWQKLVKRVKIQMREIAERDALIRRYESDIANNSLSYMLMKEKYEKIMAWASMSRPDLLKLLAAVQKQEAKAKAGVLKPISVTVKHTRRKPPSLEI